MNVIDIKKMNVRDRLQMMEALWDSLLAEKPDIESPVWHKDILEDRKTKIKNGKAEFVSLKELKANRN